MIKQERFEKLSSLNNFLKNSEVTKSNIINIQKFYDRGNTDWNYFYILFYYDEFYLEEL